MTADAPDAEDLAYHRVKVDAFLDDLRAYLLAADHGTAGSWPELKYSDIHEAESIVDRLLMLKWGCDCDRDSPVKFMMWARRLGFMPFDMPLLQSPRDESVDAKEVRLLENIGRASCAVSAYAQQIGQAERQLTEIKRNRACVQAARQVWLVSYVGDEAWKAGLNGRDVPSSLHASAEEAQEFAKAQSLGTQNIAVRWAVPPTFADPGDTFKAYFDEVSRHFGQVLPLYTVLNKLGLRAAQPTEQNC